MNTPTARTPKNPPATGPQKRRGLQAPAAVGKPPLAPGDPRPAESQEENLALPHERDESIGGSSVQPKPDPLIVQAQKDIESGQVDTDLHNMPGADAERRAELLGDSGSRGDRGNA